MGFKAATKKQLKLRMGIVAPAGAGKTFTALTVARGLVGPEGKIALLDTEHRSAEKYADLFAFDVDYLSEDCAPARYVEKINDAASVGYDCLIIDSLTHAWAGTGGALEMVDAAAKRARGNSYVAWRDVTPEHNRLVAAMLSTPMHVIATLRAKTEYVLETNAQGKQVSRKVGMAPIQREGMDYEFDVVGDMDFDHSFIVTKTRCAAIDGKVWTKPTSNGELVKHLRAWLGDGAPCEIVEDAPRVEVAAANLDAIEARQQAIRELKSAQKTLGFSDADMGGAIGALIGKPTKDASLSELETAVGGMAFYIMIVDAAKKLTWNLDDLNCFTDATIGKSLIGASATELEILKNAIEEQVKVFATTSTPETARKNAPKKEKTNE